MRVISFSIVRLCLFCFVSILIFQPQVDPALSVKSIHQFDAPWPPAAQVEFVDKRFGKPPLVYLTVDVRLRNYNELPRWFLIPSNLGAGHAPIGGKGGIDALETFSLSGKGSITLGRFLGTGGFNAILLSPHGDVRLRRFPISYWGELPEKLPLEIVIAKSLQVGTESAESWFGSDSLDSRQVDIPSDAESTQGMGKTKRTPDNKEVVPVIDVERRIELQVSLEPR